jgi:iron complex outermembrane recepter protein
VNLFRHSLAISLVLPAALLAQRTPRDTLSDSARTQSLPTVRVTVTQATERVERVPWAVGIATAREVRRGQPTVDLSEALRAVPGVYVADRYNFAVDSRVAIRGFGSRANFGLRGVKVLLDGIPQTLPDGQSQITNIDLGAVDRVEVLRGSTSSLYGNGSAGVLAFSTDMSAPSMFQQSVRGMAGSFGLQKWQARTSGRVGNASGMVSLSRLTTDGFRQWSNAEVRQLSSGIDYAMSPATVASLRVNLADVPHANNPGALTVTEYDTNLDSAAAANINRGADKLTKQNQVALLLHHSPREGEEWMATVYGGTRDVKNGLATPPPGTAGANNGTFVTIDRGFGGGRLSGAKHLGTSPRAPTLSAGVEAQRMHDDRKNQRSTRGRPTVATDTLLLDQTETVTSTGPFAQLAWSPTARVNVSAGTRYDRVKFAVDDHFLRDGKNDTSDRTTSAWSGHGGVSILGSTSFAPYANVSSSFETPTTSELQAKQDGTGGFNPNLSPQRALSLEAGARGQLGGRLGYDVALFRVRVRDAIVQFLENSGRAYFQNAGQTHNDGAEMGLTFRVSDAVSLSSAYTWSHFRFGEYRQQRRAIIDTLDGKRMPGVPEHFVRFSLRSRLTRGLTLDVDHAMSSAMRADDLNTIRVEGWGPGVMDARLTWTATVGGTRLEPFVGGTNLLDRTYVAAVTINGAFGRVREPGAPRAIYAGMEIGWATSR